MSEYKSAFELLTDDADEVANYEMRANMMLALRDMIELKGWTQKEAAEILGVTQPRISNLKHGQISKFSVDTLMSMMMKLGFSFNFTYKHESPDSVKELSDMKLSMQIQPTSA